MPQVNTELVTLCDKFFDDSVALNPFFAPYIGVHEFDHVFGNDLTDDYLVRSRQLTTDALAAVAALEERNEAPLDGLDAVVRDAFVWTVKNQQRRLDFPFHLMPLDQMNGRHNAFAQLGSGKAAQPFNTELDYGNWLRKVDGWPEWVDTAIERMTQGITSGVTLPRVIAEKLVVELGNLTVSGKESVFFQPIANLPENLRDKCGDDLEVAYLNAINDIIVPGYVKLHTFMQNEYVPAARQTHGWVGLPGGDEWYRFLAELHTTLPDVDPLQLAKIGREEVGRIHQEMDAVIKEVNFEGDRAAFFTYLSGKEFHFESAGALLTEYESIKKRVKDLIPNLFSRQPIADYEIRPMDAFRAGGPAAEYYPSVPASDSHPARPGIFYVNTNDISAHHSWDTETLSLHEAIPGHHFQISLAQEQSFLPKFLRFSTDFTAYVEGWALYCESIGKELGVFTDPYQFFGKLNDEILRAMRLVVDVGLHVQGWSREQAIAYMKENSNLSETNIVNEVERYMVMPGQALAYKVGQLTITSLRASASDCLGTNFSVRDFHEQVLANGALPLSVLQRVLCTWTTYGGINESCQPRVCGKLTCTVQ
eukprot:TRINITY_DN3538_c0_g1_i1.p1 TRINITY_DN3538_c0_g1~~TRINITY_DN3538_c0_g1_i1.p1  ORF type:complete len:592 (-),score=120.79 TRINITY_DN3538_c0_g1_i1:22-1797(-)